MRRSMLVIAACLCSFPAMLAAQGSCPAADSALGPKSHEYLKTKYDKFADSTAATTLTEGEISGMSIAGDAQFGFGGYFAGKALADSAVTNMTAVIVTADGRGGVLSAPTKLDMGMAKYQDVAQARFLLDDSVRISLPVQSHAARIKPGDDLAPPFLLETLTFAAPMDALVKLGHASKGEIRIGDVTKKLHGNTLHSVRALARYLICAR